MLNNRNLSSKPPALIGGDLVEENLHVTSLQAGDSNDDDKTSMLSIRLEFVDLQVENSKEPEAEREGEEREGEGEEEETGKTASSDMEIKIDLVVEDEEEDKITAL